QGKSGYILDYKANNSVIAVNRLLKENYSVYFSGENVKIGQKKYPGGTIIIPQKQGLHNKLQALAKELSIDFTGISSSPKCSGYRLKKPKIGLYKPWSASMSEGWNRWVLEQYEFDFKNLSNAEVKAGELIDRYSAIYIPDIGPKGIIEGRPKGSIPPAYTGGIGKDGLRNLKEFVKKGGTLILLDSACDLIIGEFGLPVANTLKGVKSEDFFCPGSILNIEVDNTHPVAFGVPGEASAFFARSPAFKIIPSFTIDADVVAKYPGKNPLKSGWIIGEKNIFNKAAVVHIPYEKGHIILIGFKVIQRAQSCGTFKILFNSLYLSASTKARLP
ncbi:hypothetical protein KAS50_07120, partial [bacterium]|nr:hypothetical protein [bacterium]